MDNLTQAVEKVTGAASELAKNASAYSANVDWTKFALVGGLAVGSLGGYGGKWLQERLNQISPEPLSLSSKFDDKKEDEDNGPQFIWYRLRTQKPLKTDNDSNTDNDKATAESAPGNNENATEAIVDAPVGDNNNINSVTTDTEDTKESSEKKENKDNNDNDDDPLEPLDLTISVLKNIEDALRNEAPGGLLNAEDESMEKHIEAMLKKYNLTLENAPEQNIVIYIHGFSFSWDDDEVKEFNSKIMGLSERHKYILGMDDLKQNLRGQTIIDGYLDPDKDLKVLTFDFVWESRSISPSKVAGFRAEQYTEHLYKYVKKLISLKFKSITLIAHSMGNFIMLNLLKSLLLSQDIQNESTKELFKTSINNMKLISVSSAASTKDYDEIIKLMQNNNVQPNIWVSYWHKFDKVILSFEGLTKLKETVERMEGSFKGVLSDMVGIKKYDNIPKIKVDGEDVPFIQSIDCSDIELNWDDIRLRNKLMVNFGGDNDNEASSGMSSKFLKRLERMVSDWMGMQFSNFLTHSYMDKGLILQDLKDIIVGGPGQKRYERVSIIRGDDGHATIKDAE